MILEFHRVLNTSDACSHDCASAGAIVTVQSVAGNEGVDEIAIESVGDFLEVFEADLLLGLGDFEGVEGFLVYLQDCGELGLGHAQGGADCADPA